eukprot:1183016-Prorocentrum_minimum.AAC.6
MAAMKTACVPEGMELTSHSKVGTPMDSRSAMMSKYTSRNQLTNSGASMRTCREGPSGRGAVSLPRLVANLESRQKLWTANRNG